ncbi:MAG TPA: biotin--[acetyl-CoA-carboxylase] ligase [Candidatus Limnocylindrales bacterium]|nr:biotin--[acetyl-CoA-carboxylase] ligase [Candidatus Limnocylindrales bacterium]
MSGAEQVLDALRRASGAPCSGETLSVALGVSRAQVWKHVEGLRARGYGIAGAPGDGYRLESVPDLLFPEELRAGLVTRWLGHRIHYFDRTDSTNRVAADLARQGAAHGDVVVAEGQTAGRGRLGRSFFSPPYQNLYHSIVLRPSLTTAEAPTIILAAAIAVAEAVADEVGGTEGVEIKWPNDVLLGGLKTSGILMELAAEATRVGFLILGIGVNLNVDRRTFPDDFRALATSIASHTGRPVERLGFTRRLWVTLESVLDLHAARGFEALRPRFQAFFHMAGRRVRVADLDGTETVGIASDIDADGALLLRGDDGARRRLVAGDVTVLKEGAPA